MPPTEEPQCGSPTNDSRASVSTDPSLVQLASPPRGSSRSLSLVLLPLFLGLFLDRFSEESVEKGLGNVAGARAS